MVKHLIVSIKYGFRVDYAELKAILKYCVYALYVIFNCIFECLYIILIINILQKKLPNKNDTLC